MRAMALGLALLVLPASAWAQMGGPGGGMGGGRHGGMGMGRGGQGMRGGQRGPMRAFDPIKRERLDKTVEALFREADANRDGTLTAEEVRSVIEAKRDSVIRARFDRVDANHDHRIDADEFLAWQRKMGDAALNEIQPQTDDGSPLPDAIDVPGKDDKLADRVIRRLVGPLDAVTLANANTNYDQGVTLDELLAYERAKFDKADTDHDGALSMDELRAAGMAGARRMGGARPGGEAPDDDGE